MCRNAQRDGHPLGGSELWSYFCHLWTKVHRIKFASARVSDSLQRHFLIDDVLSRSRYIRDQVTKLCEIVQKFSCFWDANQNF